MHTLLPYKKYCTKCKSLHFEQTKKCKYCKEVYRDWQRNRSPEQKAKIKIQHDAWRERNQDKIRQYRQTAKEKKQALKDQGLVLRPAEDRRYVKLVKLLFEAQV